MRLIELLLRDRHRNAFAALCATATQHLATTTGLLAGTKTVRPFAALVMRLIRTLHGFSPAFAERDRYSLASGVSSSAARWPDQSRKSRRDLAPVTMAFSPRNGSSIAVDFVLQSRNAICYVRLTFSCGQLVRLDAGSTPEEGVNNFWIGCTFACELLCSRTRNYRTKFLEPGNEPTAALG